MKKKTKKPYYEKRMYGFVMYNLSEIQKGIQFGHAVVEYANYHDRDKDYKDWAKMDKTFVILSGGTSNDGITSLYGKSPEIGDMQKIAIELRRLNRVSETDFHFGSFHEPDCNNALTALCFLVDERVYDYEKYPEFDVWKEENTVLGGCPFDIWKREVMGGELNYHLRELLKGKKLA